MSDEIKFICLRGAECEAHMGAMADLRILVFKEWPYLYAGTIEYEKEYLKRYMEAENSFIGLALDQGKLIGMTTAMDLREESEAFRKPFELAGLATSEIVYYGESIVQPEYRGRGIGHKFMALREDFVRGLPEKRVVAFCSVIRPREHGLRPKSYRPLNDFWTRLGFREYLGLIVSLKWKDIDDPEETEKQLQVWLKTI